MISQRGSPTLDQLQQAAELEGRSMGVKGVKVSRVTVGGGAPAVLLRFVVESSGISLALRQYLVPGGGAVHALTLTTDREKEYAATFDRIGRAFGPA